MSSPSSARLEVIYQRIDALTLDPENARKHPAAHIRAVARSIEAFGYNAPILVDVGGKVLAGHGRLMACRHLGMEEVPTIRLDHLSPDQARAYAIADNKLSDLSVWDQKQLGRHFKTLSALDLTFDIEATGFAMGEIDLAIEGLELGINEDEDAADELPPPGPSICEPGDLWILGDHKILCGSALEEKSYSKLMAGELAAAVLTDPPYNVPINGHVSGKGKNKHREFSAAVGEMSGPEFTLFLQTACRLAAQHSTEGSVHFYFMDWGHIQQLLAAGGSVYAKLLNICVWAKNNGGMGGLYRSAHELIAVFRHGASQHRNNVQLGRFGRNRTNVWNYPGANSFLKTSEEGDLLAQHPTPKPVAMLADAILDVTARRDIVLDGFLGSGSTLIACERVGRFCRGLELDPLYVDLTIRRWQRLTGEAATLAGSGESFGDLERRAREAGR